MVRRGDCNIECDRKAAELSFELIFEISFILIYSIILEGHFLSQSHDCPLIVFRMSLTGPEGETGVTLGLSWTVMDCGGLRLTTLCCISSRVL